MRAFALALLASLLTGIYWWIAFTIVYAEALFAGDRNPAAQPTPDGEAMTRSIAVIAVAVLLYAALMLLWRRFARRR